MSQNGLYTQRVQPNQWSAQGWQDYLADRPFPADYDSWTQAQQRHYERGRLRAAGARLVYRRRIPRSEPRDIVPRTNGLKLVPRSTRRRPLAPRPQAREY
jgi:hypothetical protein